MRLLLALGFVAVAHGSVLKVERSTDGTTFVCGQQTTLHFSTSENAAGTPEFSEYSATDGKCYATQSADVKLIKFCGPGKLLLSRMTCHPERHDWKATTYEHPASEYTTNCEVLDLKGTVVDGWLGSFTLSC